ncbi:MAG: class I tRNA ligase family protein, partial [Saccharofermentanales bacterium]
LPYEHSYPFCWRCDTALIYYARDTWFIEMTKLRENLIRNNKTINWMPETIRDGRFGNFLDNVVDWGISRERYWGTPLPIWECGCGHRHMIGSIEELKSMSEDCPDDIELHKPYIDAVHIRCSECGGRMGRVSEVIDCWFDSGSMPFAQWHYPFENKETFEDQYPANFISEAVDQTRGWFYTLLAISTLLFDNASFKNCIVLGLVLDKEGIKMSKHKGNVVNPWEVLDKQGADAVRWYFYTASAPWLPSRFSADSVIEAQRKFMGTLWNTYAFYVMYANIDNFIFDAEAFKKSIPDLPVIDRWLLSKLNSLVDKVDKGLENYDITGSARAISDFTDELSNWYVRRNRERFWAVGMEENKKNAYSTLYTALTTVAKLAAPFVPFMAESIYRNLVLSVNPDAPESVHLCDFPAADMRLVDKALEQNMDDALHIVVMGRAARNTCAIKNRQPIGRMYVKAPKQPDQEFTLLIADELNVKEIVYINDTSALFDYRFKPQLKTLGRKMGRMIPAISVALSGLNGIEAMNELKATNMLKLDLNGETAELLEEDLIIDTVQVQGLSTESDRDFTVSLDTTLSGELIEEGFVREIVSKVQTMRKEAGFEVLDRIVFGFEAGDLLSGIINANCSFISEEVLADSVTGLLEGYVKEWDINGEAAVFSVKKL